MARILRRSMFLRLFPKPLPFRDRGLLPCSKYCFSSHGRKETREESFQELFRKSQFAKLVRPVDKIVVGEIMHIVNNELYIDMGWKFHAVVKVDSNRIKSGVYNVGDTVEVKINELEMTGHFLGQFKRITLCEADVSLVESHI